MGSSRFRFPGGTTAMRIGTRRANRGAREKNPQIFGIQGFLLSIRYKSDGINYRGGSFFSLERLENLKNRLMADQGDCAPR